jgi:hypothetical protein
MALLVVLVLTGVVVSITAVAALVAARRRLTAELAFSRGEIVAEIEARERVKGLLDVSHEAGLRAGDELRRDAESLRLELTGVRAALEEQEAARALAAEEARNAEGLLARERARAEEALAQERARAEAEIEPLQREVERRARESAAAELREREALAAVQSLEAKLANLITSSASATRALTARAAELSAARAEAEAGAAQIARQRSQLLAELEDAKRASAEAEEARRLSEEEARIARTAKESFAGEARLLREETLRIQANLDEALRRSDAPPAPLSVSLKPLPVKHTITWWCTACNEGGVPAVKPHVCAPIEKKR